MLKYLLANQDNPMHRLHQTDRWGWTMLHHAANNGHAEICTWLLENYARPHQLSYKQYKALNVTTKNTCLKILQHAMFERIGLILDGEFERSKIR